MDQNAILTRLKELTGKTEDKEIAELLGMKKSNFSSRKQRDSLVGPIAEWAIINNIDLNYLLKGTKDNSVKYEFLKKIERWMNFLSEKDDRAGIWFEFEFEKKFPDFKEWEKRKEGEIIDGEGGALSKVA